jgi:hypothetical protein
VGVDHGELADLRQRVVERLVREPARRPLRALDGEQQGEPRVARARGHRAVDQARSQEPRRVLALVAELVGPEPQRRAHHDEQSRKHGGEHGIALYPAASPQDRTGLAREDRLEAADPAEVLGEVESGPVAARAVLLHRRLDHDLEVGRDRGVQGAHVRRLARQDRLVQAVARRPLEGLAQGQALVENRAERVDVGAPVDPLAARRDLLGRHVRGGAEDLARQRERVRVVLLVASQAEVEEDGLPLGRDHDVGGLDVAVDDAGLVGDVQGAGGALDEEDAAHHGGAPRSGGDRADARAGCVRTVQVRRSRFGLGEVVRKVEVPAPARRVELLRERLALEVAHRDVVESALDSHLVDDADPGVMEARGDLGFAPQARGGSARRGSQGDEEVGAVQDLQGDAAGEARVLGQVDDALAAAAELLQEAVGTEALVERGLLRCRLGGIRVGRRRTESAREPADFLLCRTIEVVMAREKLVDVDAPPLQREVEVFVEKIVRDVRHGSGISARSLPDDRGIAIPCYLEPPSAF